MADIKIEWSTELVDNLIENVRINEVVWDISNSKYKSKNAQETAWLNIARECGLEGRPACVKAKWRDLRDTYRKKLKLLLPKSGDAGGARKVSWQWMQKMSFLKGFSFVETPTTSNFVTINDEESSQLGLSGSSMSMEASITFHDDDSSNEAQDNDMTSGQGPRFSERTKKRDATGDAGLEILEELRRDKNAHCTSPAAGPSGYCNTPTGPNFSGKRKKWDEVNKLDQAILDELRREKDEDDEDSHFLKSLIPQFKRLDPRSKAFVKCQIQQLLFEAEFGTTFQQQ